jgi:nucleotide-binding universal stress UspA family protein
MKYMDRIMTILVPFDFSRAAKTALDYAVNYAGRSSDMHIKLLYTDEGADATYSGKDFVAVKKSYGKNLISPLTWAVSREPLTQAILQARNTYDAELIIMGTAGAPEEPDTATHTSRLVLKADCPVLVIPQPAREFKLKKIALVLGRDEIEDTDDLATLLDVARRFNAQVHVLTIENEPGDYGYSEIDERNEKLLEHYLESFYADHTYIENPDVMDGISQYAADKDLDMIAILPRNHNRRSEPSEGRLTQILTLKSKTPVLAID